MIRFRHPRHLAFYHGTRFPTVARTFQWPWHASWYGRLAASASAAELPGLTACSTRRCARTCERGRAVEALAALRDADAARLPSAPRRFPLPSVVRNPLKPLRLDGLFCPPKRPSAQLGAGALLAAASTVPPATPDIITAGEADGDDLPPPAPACAFRSGATADS